jgi:hypothetical protein
MTGVAEARPPTEIDGEIEREIGRTRRRIGRTLDALSQKLAARRLLRRGSRWVGAEVPSRPELEARFRADPLALGLIGAGVAWLVAENAQLFRRRRRHGAASANRARSGDDLRPGVAGDAAEGTVTAAGLCQAGGQDRPNPLLTGLIGLVAGAALATLLPATRRERQLVARAREDLWRQVEALGHQTAARVRDFGRRSTASATDRSSVK